MKLIVDGLAVNYEDQGKGPVVVLLHGWGIKGATFEVLAKRLAKHYRVLWLDLPGFGESEQPKNTWSVGEYASFVAKFLDKLGVHEAHALLGHSFGGRLIIKGVATGALRASKAVLMGSAGVKYSDSLRNRGFKVVAKVGKAALSLPYLSALKNPLRKRLHKAAGSTDYTELVGPMREIFIKTIEEDLLPYTTKLTIPVLMVWGKNDEVTPLADAHKLAAAMKDVRIEVLEGAHFVYLDQPDQSAKLIEEFLSA
jgi:pimeloyl-ACP methyl ester carboxylesterase